MEADRLLLDSRWSRRAAARLLGGGLALVLAGTADAADAAERRKKKPDKRKPNKKKKKPNKPKFKTATKTFTNDAVITINDDAAANPYPSAIEVSGFKRGSKLIDVNVVLSELTHTWPTDIDVLLQGPGGKRAKIMSDAGLFQEATDVTLTLDDQAANSLPEEAEITTGTYKPTNFGNPDAFPAPGADTATVSLATFKGINPNGTWQLFVVDDAGRDTGDFGGGWSLTIKARYKV